LINGFLQIAVARFYGTRKAPRCALSKMSYEKKTGTDLPMQEKNGQM
jgi:hypothetical protein